MSSNIILSHLSKSHFSNKNKKRTTRGTMPLVVRKPQFKRFSARGRSAADRQHRSGTAIIDMYHKHPVVPSVSWFPRLLARNETVREHQVVGVHLMFFADICSCWLPLPVGCRRAKHSIRRSPEMRYDALRRSPCMMTSTTSHGHPGSSAAVFRNIASRFTVPRENAPEQDILLPTRTGTDARCCR
jgi:hypothetical protein